MKEIWHNIQGHEGAYQVSSHGRVKSLDRKVKQGNRVMRIRGQVMSLTKNNSGYLRVRLKGNHVFVHRLVAKAFIRNSEEKPCVNHLDGDKTNNHVSNLEWCTHSENMKHSVGNGLHIMPSYRGEKHPGVKLTRKEVVSIRERYKSGTITQTALANEFGLHQSTIWMIVARKSWTHV